MNDQIGYCKVKETGNVNPYAHGPAQGFSICDQLVTEQPIESIKPKGEEPPELISIQSRASTFKIKPSRADIDQVKSNLEHPLDLSNRYRSRGMGETESSKARPVKKNVSNQADDDDDDSRARAKKGTRAETGVDEVEAMLQELGSLKVSKSTNSRRSQESTMETSSSDEESDGGEDIIEEQKEINTTLSAEDTALFAELMQVIKKGGELKKLRIDHLKSYLRYHGLRLSGLKDVLVSRIEQHLKIKDGQGEAMYPKPSFTINCRGDVCLGDTVLFSQIVYEEYDIVRRSSGRPPLGMRTVAGKVVNESYGAGKQQHTFTIEVLWSTGTQPWYVMRPLQIKGRNLYRMHTYRQKWDNEEDRKKVLAEKHARGEEARAKRRAAKELKESSRSKSRSRAQSKTTRHLEESSSHTIAAAGSSSLRTIPSRRGPMRNTHTQSSTTAASSQQAGQYR